MKLIRDIDKDRNGYVTNSELIDILKINYSAELESKDLYPFVK
jgi:Ca2+-binding EF-hand superfamily protein